MTTTTTDGLTETEAWNIAIADILDTTARVIDSLDHDTRTKISHAITNEATGYNGADDLAHRARTALNYLNNIN